MMLTKELHRRIDKILHELGSLRYSQEIPVCDYTLSKEKPQEGPREYHWFEKDIVILPEFDGKCVFFNMQTGIEGGHDDFSFYLNGKFIQGIDREHNEVLLEETAYAGQRFNIKLCAYTDNQTFHQKMKTSLKVLDRKTNTLYYDLKTPYDVAVIHPHDSREFITIIHVLNETINLLDLRVVFSGEYYASIDRAQEYITREFYKKSCNVNNSEIIHCVGHTHLDVAWLWPLAVTEDKTLRSFATVLQLMDEYPEYLFMSSQPQLYQYVKKNSPELYERIKECIASGRWEAEGGMWLEADCNISSGEALIRQFVHGKKFFREEFGKDNIILWLPDVFGYSAALPQIMDKCGIKYFMTTKISWNEFNKMPYDTFMWEGIDGTSILTHFISTRGIVDDGTWYFGSPNQNITTFNCIMSANEIMGTYVRYQQKNLNRELLCSFGWGDGGGGPTREMLEMQRRFAQGIPGCPVTKMGTARSYFEKLEKDVSNNKYLPSWTGELYFEFHRGVYTTMGRNKKYNRTSEITYQNAENIAVMDSIFNASEYPAQTLFEGWETILLNQFHDILPGTSIKEVYEDSNEQYEAVLKTGNEILHGKLANLTNNINTPAQSLIVFNLNGMECDAPVSFETSLKNPVVCSGEKDITAQHDGSGKAVFIAQGVPAKGWKSFSLKEGQTAAEAHSIKISADCMENIYFAIKLNSKGQFSSIYDKTANRELLPAGQCANVIMSYEDKPCGGDAWDINHFYTEQSWEIDQIESISVTAHGLVYATLRIDRKYLNSTITQYITMYAGIPRIDIGYDIDWKEKQILVKSLFPFDINTDEAAFDIQFGNVKRKIHQNTSWDAARFEVCMQKWLDVSEEGYGLSILNDCKYGVSIQDKIIGLTMLRSTTSPNPDADRERHVFSYSLYPHSEGWREAGTVQQAAFFNNPMIAAVKENTGGTMQNNFSLVTCDSENVIVETIKQAEDGSGIILRLYECHNRRTAARLEFGIALKSVCVCNMLEEEETPIKTENGNLVKLTVKPYEIVTLKIKV
ncbi:MAG: alpha-mannosidase [Treponema sp.]|nr:alpha-mannosidase [Treponema sp.]